MIEKSPVTIQISHPLCGRFEMTTILFHLGWVTNNAIIHRPLLP